MNQSDAGRGAAAALKSIEFWARATFIASVAGVGILVLIAGALAYVGNDYLAAKRKASEALEEFRVRATATANGAPSHAQPRGVAIRAPGR